MSIETLHEVAVVNMNVVKELRKQLSNSSMTLKEYKGVKDTLNLLSNLSSDMVSLSKVLKDA